MDATNSSPNTPPAASPPTSLQDRLQADMKAAMKSADRGRLGVIRMVLTEVRNADLATPKQTPEQAAAGYAKKLRKSVEEFQKVGNDAQVQALRAEIAVVEGYLPQKASPARTAELVDAFMASKAFTPAQVGQAIGAFMKQHGGDVDPAEASRLIRERL